MPDREKVLLGLKYCGKGCNSKCPYWHQFGFGDDGCTHTMRMDALELLKEQDDEIKILHSDLNDLQKEHDKLLDKKIPLITNGQEVVRCKDCKHWWYGNYCDKHGKGQDIADWFCADGERGSDDG